MDAGLGVQGVGRSLSRSRGIPPKGAQRPTSGGRRSNGAVPSEICPPPGKLVKTVAVARSEEHVFNLSGGRVNQSGKPIEAPGNSYTLNPTGQPHSAMIATENIALVIYSGETDDVKSVEIVDIEPALGGWQNSRSADEPTQSGRSPEPLGSTRPLAPIDHKRHAKSI